MPLMPVLAERTSTALLRSRASMPLEVLIRRRRRPEPGVVGDRRQQLAAARDELTHQRRVHHLVADRDAHRMALDRQQRRRRARREVADLLGERRREKQQALHRHVLAERHEVDLAIDTVGRPVRADQERAS